MSTHESVEVIVPIDAHRMDAICDLARGVRTLAEALKDPVVVNVTGCTLYGGKGAAALSIGRDRNKPKSDDKTAKPKEKS
jgi:hypothetical protein